MEDVVQKIRNLPMASVFALYNRKKGKVFLTFGKDTTKRLCSIIAELRNNSHKLEELVADQEDLELIILETSNNSNTDVSYQMFRQHMNYWYDYIETSGLSLYGKRHNYLEYKPRITYGINYEGETVVFVNLVTRRNDSFTVGVFSNYFEAEEFKKRYFEEQKYVYPVYANNDLTRDFVKTENERLENVFKVRGS